MATRKLEKTLRVTLRLPLRLFALNNGLKIDYQKSDRITQAIAFCLPHQQPPTQQI
ncbi:hypothetical protein [Nostoc sp. FACHB-110]|uniref:hypothetical protein n=1 Tax=Nostoc sp. FACHB-110 TaxID=2692834 RepID=UPI00168A1241|nr:hypothetical protein [Nostoc sp. FACHB-110]MBD2437984.1 hypothetical protein [Nostoc sp. FACHB-110]